MTDGEYRAIMQMNSERDGQSEWALAALKRKYGVIFRTQTADGQRAPDAFFAEKQVVADEYELACTENRLMNLDALRAGLTA